MARIVSADEAAGLEGLCAPVGRIRPASGVPGIGRLEAHFLGRPFAPHRHDTYAIGLTIAGVQEFTYRGVRRRCLPGQCHVLHPDEIHDGAAATAAGFAYRILYLDPALVQSALGEVALPFVADPLVARTRLPPAMAEALALQDEIDASDLVTAAADFLALAAGGPRRPLSLCQPGLARIRDLIAARPARFPPMAELERVSGLDRWTLARQFRAAYGTSPRRFRTMRQLDLARRLLERGMPPAEAAAAAGFADQSHLGRQFKRAFGLTPSRWASAALS